MFARLEGAVVRTREGRIEPVAYSNLLHVLGQHRLNEGEYGEAARHYRERYDFLLEQFGENDVKVRFAGRDLAYVLLRAGEAEEAQRWIRPALRALEASLGSSAPAVELTRKYAAEIEAELQK